MKPMKRKHPAQQDNIEQAMRLLSRAAERLKPHGTLMLTLQWVPAEKQPSGKKEKK